ncbi:hypothetical protein I3842_02G080300 [Carya illinoinensis]|uniref:Uncharacterized protein n=1 Tax=Carya illinoinensis TaxID=32201 RepID=A0A922K4E8_CARIL|nr:hypothetical protein I3842_02G080300 [Carya illinoinensis]
MTFSDGLETVTIFNPSLKPIFVVVYTKPLRISAEAEALDLPSPCDSTVLRVQSPNPAEILSNKSPEKRLLPHPTDLDLQTLRSRDKAEAVAWLVEPSSSSLSSTMLLFSPREDPGRFFFLCLPTEPFVASAAFKVVILEPFLKLLSVLLEAPDFEEEEAVVGEEEEELRIGREKEEETSLPSFSWRQNGQIPPGLFL